MRVLLGLLVVDGLALGVGLSLLGALGLARARSVLDVALAFVAGWAELGVAWTLLAIAGAAMTAWEAIAVAVVLIVAQELVARRRPAEAVPAALDEADRRARIVAIVGAAGVSLVLACGLVVASTSSADTEWDVWAFWLPKAKSIYYLDGLHDGPDGITTFASAEYPPLAAVVDAVTFRFAGVHPADLLLQRWLLLAGFFLGLAGLLLRQARPALVWPPLAMLAAAPATVRYADSLLADPLVAVTVALAAVCGVVWLLEPSRAFALLTALFLAAAALVKTEGFLLGALLGVLLLAFGLSTRRYRDLAVIVLAPVAALLPWKLWLELHDAPLWSELYDFGDLFRPGYLLDRIDRLGYALEHMTRSVLAPDLWLLSLPIVAVAIVLAAPRNRRLAGLAASWILVAFAGLASVYWISPLPIEFYVDTSAQRVLISIVVVSVALTPLLLEAALEPAPRTVDRRESESRPARGIRARAGSDATSRSPA